MKPCRVFLILLVMILCIGVISVCVFATSSEPTGYSLPEVVPPIISAEGAANDGSTLENDVNDFPSVTETHQEPKTEPSPEPENASNLTPTNTIGNSEANKSASEDPVDPSDSQSGSQAETQPASEATQYPPDAQAAQDAEAETNSNDGLHFRIVKTSEAQEEVIADYSSWELAILVAIWLLATIILFVVAIMFVMRLTRR